MATLSSGSSTKSSEYSIGKEEMEFTRSGSYPLQSSEFTPHKHPEPLPESEKKQDRLPRTIRAVKDNTDTEEYQPRTVIICLDGTGDRFDNDNSNIVHFVSCLKKHKPQRQVTYYQSGIGTYDGGGLQNGFGAVMDMAVGSGLGVHVKDAYKFLMQNYQEGDRICLLGFSRGAYTVRCLAGMLHKVGLLPASNGSQVNFAYDFYKDNTKHGFKMSAQFKRTFCTDVNVYFVGLFDCVASVGFVPRKLPFSKSPTNSIHFFRHAMALDEHRAKFKVCQYSHVNPDPKTGIQRRDTFDNTPTGKLKRTGVLNCFSSKEKKDEEDAPIHEGEKHSGFFHRRMHKKVEQKTEKQIAMEAKFEAQIEEHRRHQKVETDALEVWFKGAHADVGGGSVDNKSRHMLSRIPLRWMIRQCFECNTGILFDTAALAEQGLDVETLYPIYKTPVKPTVGPIPALVEKKKNNTLAPLQQRSTFLPIGPEDETIKDAPTAEDLSYILPSECTENYFDSTEEPRDQLKDAKGWWILEFWPIKVRVVAKDGDGWEKKVRVNMGRYRAVREREPKIHWTVNHVISLDEYEIKARIDQKSSWVEVV